MKKKRLSGDKRIIVEYLISLPSYPARFSMGEIADAVGIPRNTVGGKVDDLAIDLPFIHREQIANLIYYVVRTPYPHELEGWL